MRFLPRKPKSLFAPKTAVLRYPNFNRSPQHTGGGFDLLAGLESPRVLVARDISPSEMAMFDRRKILGVVTELGSPTSHTAIMARAMELPAIAGLRAKGVIA